MAAINSARDGAPFWLMRHAPANPEDAGAGATDYMRLTGPVALGYMWCRIVEAGMGRLARGRRRRAHARQARHRPLLLFERMLRETPLHPARIRLGAGNIMELPAEAF
jgi:hypothetical protein